MRKSGLCSRFLSALALSVCALHGAAVVAAPTDYEMRLFLAPPAQSTNSTCQSYVLAVGLSLLDTSSFTSPQWSVQDETEFRRNEMLIRAAIEGEMGNRKISGRPDWIKALKKLTFGQYTLGEQQFTSMDDLANFLKDKAPVKTKLEGQLPFLIPHPSTTYFTSFRRIEHSTYREGHLVSIVGLNASLPARSNKAPELLLLNSAVKGDDNECLPAQFEKNRWFGSSSWVTDYEVKRFPDGRMIINWVKLAH